ncbi:MAG: N-acetylglucosamine-6-phosphate deacetylase [Cyanophyceae cyanobacterium]
MGQCWLVNGSLVDRPGRFCLRLDAQGRVAALESMDVGGKTPWVPNGTDAEGAAILDLAGDWLSPGGVDVQINGGLGLAFPDLTPTDADLERLEQVAAYLWDQGVDGFVPTIVTTAIAKVQGALAAIARYRVEMAGKPGRAAVLGAHLEGPFLNLAKRGAHPQEHLQPLTADRVAALLGDWADQVTVVTLAPELDPTGEAIAWLRDRGIVVSLGHSQATASEAAAAFDRGATMVTHAFNAMPPLHHREPGLLGAAIARAGVQCGFIADGVHVHPTMLKLLIRAAGGDRGLFLVSDALSPLGLPDGQYPWDDRQITVQNGTARLPDGTLSGTTLPLLDGVKNLVRWQVCESNLAIHLAAIAPRTALQSCKTLSSEAAIAPDPYLGQEAKNLLRWHQSGNDLTWQRLGDTLQPA